MRVGYGGPSSALRYDCSRGVSDYAEPLCQSLSGGVLDEFVAGQLLAAVEPAALEASLATARESRAGGKRHNGEHHREHRRRKSA